MERAYLLSKNKSVFFEQEALTEANRYVAALYTAIAYDRPRCVELLLSAIARRDAAKHSFYVSDDTAVLESLEAAELARTLGELSSVDKVNKGAEASPGQKMWGGHARRARGARAWDPGAEPLVRDQGAKPPEAENLLAFGAQTMTDPTPPPE